MTTTNNGHLAEVANLIAWALDGEYHDGEDVFFAAVPNGDSVRLTITDGKSDTDTKFKVTVEMAP